jgi:hypothetical protein
MFFLLVIAIFLSLLSACTSNTTPLFTTSAILPTSTAFSEVTSTLEVTTSTPTTSSITSNTTSIATSTIVPTTVPTATTTTSPTLATTTEKTIESVTILASNLTSIWLVESFSVNQLRLRIQYSNGTVEFIYVNPSMVSTDDLSKLSSPGRHQITITYLSYQVVATLQFESSQLNRLLSEFYQLTDYSGTFRNWILSVTGSVDVTIVSASYNSEDQLIVILSDQSVINLGVKPLPKYLVKFFGFDGLVLSTQNVTQGESAVEPQAPSILNYTFLGWDISFDAIYKPTNIYAIYNLGDQFNLDVLMLSINRLKEADFNFDMSKIFQAAQNNSSPVVQTNRRLSKMLFPRILDETEDDYYSEDNYLQHSYWRDYYYHKSLFQLPAKYNNYYILTSTLNSYNSHTLNSIYDVTTSMTNQAKDMSEWAIDHLSVMDTWVQFPNHRYLLQYDITYDIVELYLIITYPNTGLTSYRKIRVYYNDRGEEVIELWINEYITIGSFYGTINYFNTIGGKDFNSYTFWLDQDFKPIEDSFHFRGVNRNINGGYDYYTNFDGLVSGEYGWYPTIVNYDTDTQTTNIPTNHSFTIYTPDAHSNIFTIGGSAGFYHIQLFLPSMNGLLGLLFSENGLIQENQDSENTRQMLISKGFALLPNHYTYDNSHLDSHSGILTANGVFLNTDPLWNNQVKHQKTYIRIGGEGKRGYSNYYNHYGEMHLTINASSLTEAFTILLNYLDYLGLSYKYGETDGLINEAIAFYNNAVEHTRRLIMINQESDYVGLPFENDTSSFALFHEYILDFSNFTPEILELFQNRPQIHSNQMPPLPNRSRIILIPIETSFTGTATITQSQIDASNIQFTILPTVLLEDDRQYHVIYAMRVGGKVFPFAIGLPQTYQKTNMIFSLDEAIPIPQPYALGQLQLVMFLAKAIDEEWLRVSSIVPIPVEAFTSFHGSADDASTQLSFTYQYNFINDEFWIESTFEDRLPPIIIYNETEFYQSDGFITTMELPYETTINEWLEPLKVWDFVDGLLTLSEANIFYNNNPVSSLHQVMLPGEYKIIVSDSSGNETTLQFLNITILCSIEFFDGQGGFISSVILPYGADIEFPIPPEWMGHTFDKWSLPATQAFENDEFYAEYHLNYHRITYYIDGEVYQVLDLVGYGEEILFPSVPQVGYHLVWETLITTMPDEDVMIYGTYEVNRYWVYFYINQSLYYSEEYAYGDFIVYPSYQVEDGYQFDGWDSMIHETMPDQDLIIYGTTSPIEEVE